MSDLYKMATTKTHHGNKGGSYVRAAKVVEMAAGTYEVVAVGYNLDLTDDGDLALHDSSGLQAVLELSPRAHKAMVALVARREAMYAI
jgi:hypothetical protein